LHLSVVKALAQGVRAMKKFDFEYTVHPKNSPKLFLDTCEMIRRALPNFRAKELLVDVDGSTIQAFAKADKVIVVCDDYDVGAVYIESDIDLKRFFE
jgi:hypothetical protein